MTHRIIEVKPMENLKVSVVFQCGVEKIYDIRNLYPVFPQFQELEKDSELFQKIQVDTGGYGISWNDELDLDAEEVWENGIEAGKRQDIDLAQHLGDALAAARELAGMTQKQLSAATGIYQADISRIERGIANPSLNTLKRLAGGMGMVLRVEFVPNSEGDDLEG